MNNMMIPFITKWPFGFQEPATPGMEGIDHLHNDVMFYLIGILVFVLYMLGYTIWRYSGYQKSYSLFSFYSRKEHPQDITHNTELEIIWTLTPALILIIIAVPSFALLYSMDEVIDPAITIKAIGHQWYWTYEYSDYVNIYNETLGFDSYMVPEEDLGYGQVRLLDVDNRIIVPLDTHIRMIITSADVLHSWAVPSLGMKMDAVPGRLNQMSMFIKREGVYYGQCSEICGVNHGFMPIAVEAISLDDYLFWLVDKLEHL